MNGDIQNGLAGFGRGLSSSLANRWQEERRSDQTDARDTAKALRMMKEPKPMITADQIRGFMPGYAGGDVPDNIAAAGIGAGTRLEVASGNQAGENARAAAAQARLKEQQQAEWERKAFNDAKKAGDPTGYGYGQDPGISANVEKIYNASRAQRGLKPVKLQQTVPGKPGKLGWLNIGGTNPSVQLLGGAPDDAPPEIPKGADGQDLY